MVLSDDIKAVFNAMKEGILIIDTEERIVFGNTAYKDFLSKDSGPLLSPLEGRRIREIRPNARLPEVVKTGICVMHAPRKETETVYFVNMYPIKRGGAIIGGISVVTFMSDAEEFKLEYDENLRRSIRAINNISGSEGNVNFDRIVSRARKSQNCKAYAKKIAATEFPILLISESGTGKGEYARAIHNASERAEKAFIEINCSVNPGTLSEELFGSEPGGSVGLIEAAGDGTLFIDEISEMPAACQNALMRALQRGTYRRAGGSGEFLLQARIIAASEANLEDLVRKGSFKSELYYMLNTFTLTIPPLRERMDDVPVIVRETLRDISRRMKQNIDITDEAMDCLMSYTWPGNIRELKNVLEFSAYFTKGGMITADSLPENISASFKARGILPLRDRVREFEKAEIEKALEFCGNDLPGKRKAAEELGISLASLYSKLK